MKRIGSSAINWAALAERVPPNQRSNYLNFQSKSEGYLKKVTDLPEYPPKIDWAGYQKKITLPDMVNNFQKQYESMAVPFPTENITKQIDEQVKVVNSEIAAFKSQSNAKIKEYSSELKHLNSLTPYDQLTMEEFQDCCPEVAINSFTKPTFWPHDPGEQIDFRDKGHPMYGHDPHGEH